MGRRNLSRRTRRRGSSRSRSQWLRKKITQKRKKRKASWVEKRRVVRRGILRRPRSRLSARKYTKGRVDVTANCWRFFLSQRQLRHGAQHHSLQVRSYSTGNEPWPAVLQAVKGLHRSSTYRASRRP